jgi:DNA-binding NtrC family response regulator
MSASAPSPVLIVEDDPLILESTADLLARDGCEVLRASSREEAMAILEGGRVPSVVVTDIGLCGERSGLDLARTVNDRWPDVRVLIVSGEHRPSRDEYPPRAIFFTKPYPDGALLSVLKSEDW